MPIRALFSHLNSSTAIAALVGTRIWPVKRRQKSTLPAITLNVVSDQSISASTGATGYDQARIQVDCWSTSFSGAHGLDIAVKHRLRSFTSSTTTPKIDSCQDAGGSYLGEPVEPGEDAMIHRFTRDFTIWYASTGTT